MTPEEEDQLRLAKENVEKGQAAGASGDEMLTMLGWGAGPGAGTQIKLQEKKRLTDVTPEAYYYGGMPGKAEADANYYRGLATDAQTRQGEVINYGQADQTRSSALGMAGLMAARANGTAPSIAQMQADRQMQQAAAEQTSAAASARGPAGLALAQQGAAANTAGMQANISGQAQIAAAQERLAAEQAGFQAYAGLSGQDASRAQTQAAMNAQQRAQNDVHQTNMLENEQAVRTTQLAAAGNADAAKRGAEMGYTQLQAQRKATQAAGTQQTLQTGAAIAGTAAMMMSDIRSKEAIAPLSGASGAGSMFAPATRPPVQMGMGDAGAHFGGGTGAGAGASMTSFGAPPPPPEPGFNWKGLGQGMMGLSRSLGPAPSAYGPPPAYGGGYGGGGMFMSDERAKTNAFQMGTAAGLSMAGADPRAAAWDEGHASALADMQKLSRKSPEELRAYGDHPLATAVRGLKADAWDEGRGTMQAQRQPPQADPVTQQFASGLAPSFYEYKDGMGPPGQQLGPMAQSMARNPVTATAVDQDPRSGLLGIDRDGGLKTSLAASGHLAAKQMDTDDRLQKLEMGGLLRQPGIGEQYMQFTRRGDR